MSEREIIQRVLAGDSGQFEALVDRYLPLVRGLCAGRVYNPSAHDELIQEVFVTGYLQLNRLRDPERFGPWLARIAQNECRQWLRQQGRRERFEARLALEARPPSPDPADEAATREMRDWVRRRILQLPKKTRDAMLLCYVEGMPTSEAARCLRIRETALRKRLQHGRDLIGAQLVALFGREEEDRSALKRRVLAALPVAVAPWKEAMAMSLGAKALAALAAPKALVAGPVAVLLVAAAVSVPLALRHAPERRVETETAAPAMRGGAGLPVAAQEPGSVALTLRYAGKAAPAAQAGPPVGRKHVALTPIRFQMDKLRELVRAAGLAEGYAELFAPRYDGTAANGKELRAIWARGGLSEPEMADAEQKLQFLREWAVSSGARPRLRDVRDKVRDEAVTVETDAEGRAVFDGLRAGDYQINIKLRSADGSEANWMGGSVTVDAGARIEKTCLVPDVGSVACGVVVEDGSGKPVPGVMVEVASTEQPDHEAYVMTDEQGRFSTAGFDLPYGPLAVRLKNESDFLPATAEGERVPGEPCEVELRVKRRGTVSGRVTHANGKPAPDVTLMQVGMGGTSMGEVRTDADGYYSLKHDGGVIRLYASSLSARSEEASVELAQEESGTLDFVLPDTGRLVLDVRKPDGTPPEKLSSVSFVVQEAPHNYYGLGDRKPEDGRFVFPYLKPGTYEFFLLIDGFEGQQLEFTVGPDLADVERTLHLKPAEVSARVRVVDDQGRPRTDQDVAAMWSHGDADGGGFSSSSVVQAKADPDGLYVFRGLPPGRYQFSNGGHDTEMVDVPCRETLVLEVPSAEENLTGLPFSDWNVKLVDATRGDVPLLNEFATAFVLVPSGRVTQNDLEVGANQVFVVKRGYPAGTATVTVTPEMVAEYGRTKKGVEPVKVALGEGGNITGRVLEEDGSPAAGIKLAVFPWETWQQWGAAWQEDNSLCFQCEDFGKALAQQEVTAENGTFTLRFLPPGSYAVVIGGVGDNPYVASEPVDVVAGHETGPVVLTRAVLR